LKQVSLAKLLERNEPIEVQNAVIRVFLDKNKDNFRTENELLLEAQDQAKDELVREIDENFGKEMAWSDLKTVEHFFEQLFGEKEKLESGIQYTPRFIIKYIVQSTIKHDGFVCDPSCGSGGFLVEAAKGLSRITGKPVAEIIESGIYGCDISADAIHRAKLMLSLLSAIEGCDRSVLKFNLVCGNSLLIDWKERFPKVFAHGGFDTVLGNPPFVKIQNMDEASRGAIPKRWSTVGRGSHNLYIPFIQLGSELINGEGVLGFIVSSMYFKSIASEDLRRYLQDRRLVARIVDFGDLQIFEGRQTYTCLTFVDRKPKEYLEYAILRDMGDLSNPEFTEVHYDTLNSRKWRLFSERDHRNILKIESADTKLGAIVDISTGIATLRDSLYFVDSGTRHDGHYIKLYKEKPYRIEAHITREVIKISDFLTQDQLDQNTRRIIFPYRMGNLPALISEHELAEKYPGAYEYLCDVKEELAKRDKGKRLYEKWYAYGRRQGLTSSGEKLLTPTFSDKPRFLLCARKDALFCNGYAVTLPNQRQGRTDSNGYEMHQHNGLLHKEN
jgi:adenine-specific DNA-methyltransferase